MENPHEQSTDFSILEVFLGECGENKDSYLRETSKFRFFLDDEQFAKAALEQPLACNEAVVSRRLAYIQTLTDWETRKPILLLLRPLIYLLDNALNHGEPLRGHQIANIEVAYKIRQRVAQAIIITLQPCKEKQDFLKDTAILHHLLSEERYPSGNDSCSRAQRAALQHANICSASHFWETLLSEDSCTLAEWLDGNHLSKEERLWFEKFHQELCQNNTIDANTILIELRKLLMQRDEAFKQIIDLRRKVFCAPVEANKTNVLMAVDRTCEYIPLKNILEQLFEKTKPIRSQSEKSIFATETSLNISDSTYKKRFCELLGCAFVFDPTVSEFHVAPRVGNQNALFVHTTLKEHFGNLDFQLQKAFEKWIEKKALFDSKGMQAHLATMKTTLNKAIALTQEEEKIRKVVRFSDGEQLIP